MVFIWIFQEVEQHIANLHLEKDRIVDCDGDYSKIFGYSDAEMLEMPVAQVIPYLGSQQEVAMTQGELQYFTGVSKQGVLFPVLIEFGNADGLTVDHLQVTSMPDLSGVLVVQKSGLIFTISPILCQWLFGSVDSLIIGNEVTELLPGFWEQLELSRQSSPVSNIEGALYANSRKISKKASVIHDATTPTSFMSPTTPTLQLGSPTQNLPKIMLFAKHRDGGIFPITAVLRDLWLPEQYVLWTSFYHETMLSGQICRSPSPTGSPSYSLRDGLPSGTSGSPPNEIETKQPFGAVPEFFKNTRISKDEIEDYEIIQDLGQGAYSYVKLAHHKNDKQQVFAN